MNTSDARNLVRLITGWVGTLMLLGSPLCAAEETNSQLLTVKRIFDSGEFDANAVLNVVTCE